MLVELLADRGAGGKIGDVIDVPMDEAARMFRKGTARVYRERPKPERATRKRRSEKANADARNGTG